MTKILDQRAWSVPLDEGEPAMRVAFVNQTGAKPGGAEESLMLLLKHLPHDIEPQIVVFEEGEFAQRLRDGGFTTHVMPVNEKLRSITREKPSSAGALALPMAIAELTRLLLRLRVDLVHTNTMKAHLIAAPAARMRGIPAVMHLRDMVEALGGFILRGVALTCSREQIAISNALARWYGLPHTTVVPNPVDLSEYSALPAAAEARRRLGIPVDGTPLIGIVGRINRWKGQDRFLRIAAAVSDNFPIRCAIVGEARFRDADFVPELHQLAADLGIANRTTFVPWLDDPRSAYAALDVHCNCSEREPFGRSIVEAAAAGVPTVAFDDGGAVDIISNGQTGAIVAAGDLASFTANVLHLVSDADFREASGQRAKVESARFAAPSHAARVAAVLRRAAK
jgi:glycosyltransferase involved in cell wall biosynthesis